MRILLAALIATLSGCCFGGGGIAGGELVGTVVDDATGAPIVGAVVNPYASSYGRDGAGESVPDATTDASGAFALMDMCLYRDREILATADDYVTQTLPAPFAAGCDWSSRVELRVRMTRTQPPLP